MVDDAMRTMIHDGVSEQEIERHARLAHALDPRRRPRPRAARRDHARGNAARHARGLTLGRVRIHRPRYRRQGAQGHSRGRHPAPHPPAAARAAAAAGHGRGSGAEARRSASAPSASCGASRPPISRSSPASSPRWCAPGCRSRSRCWRCRSRPRSRACRASSSGCASRVMEGHTLADGFAEFPRVFPEIYRSTVSAGEQAGHLDNVLERLADYTESREQMRQKVLAAMLYPIVLSVHVLRASSRACWCSWCRRWCRCSSPAKAKLPLITRAADRHQRLLAPLWHLPADRRRRSRSGSSGRWLRNPAAKRRFQSLAAARADRRQAGARLQYRALHPHLQHPLGAAPCRCSRRCASPARW